LATWASAGHSLDYTRPRARQGNCLRLAAETPCLTNLYKYINIISRFYNTASMVRWGKPLSGADQNSGKLQYKVVVTGKVISGFKPTKVKKKAGSLLKLDPDAIDHVFSGQLKPTAHRLDRKSATSYAARLIRHGLECRIEPDDTGAGENKSSPHHSTKMTSHAPARVIEESVSNSDDSDDVAESNDEAASGNRIKPDDLSYQARIAVRTKRFSWSFRIRYLLKLIRELATFDRKTDAYRKKYDKRLLRSLIGLWIMVALAATAWHKEASPLDLIFLGFGALFLPFLIYYAVRFYTLNKLDLDNDFRRSVAPFLNMIKEDIPGRKKVNVHLDLKGLCDDKMVQSDSIPPGRFKKLVKTIYADPWCKIEAPLFGHGWLELTIENTCVSHDRTWINDNGKKKEKTKWRKIVRVCMGLTPDRKLLVYNGNRLENVAQREKIKFRQKGKTQTAWLIRKWKYKGETDLPDRSPSPDELMDMLITLAKLLESKPSVSKT
jgi:hypothetical protein